MFPAQEAYVVPTDKRAPRASPDSLLSRVIFHDGRLVRRPDPPQAFFALAYLPFGFVIALLVFVTFAGLRARAVEAVARGVLPRHYAAGVRADTWEVFRGAGAERRVVVTASPAAMVGEFVREFLGAEVAGTELETFAGGKRFTGRIKAVLVGKRKKEVVEKLFAGGDMPDVGLGDRESDHDFMAICKVI